MQKSDSTNRILDSVNRFIKHPEETPIAKLIVPGKSIGLTTINETAESIGQKLGTPDAGDAAMGKSISTWFSKTNRLHSTTIYFTTNFGDSSEAKRVSQVRITSPYFSTRESLAVGSNFSSINKYFPSLKLSGNYPVAPKSSTMIRVYDDVNGGIAFEINPENTCIGITIHKQGERAFQTYLDFLEGYKSL